MSDSDVIDLRMTGLSCRETAQRLGIQEQQVWRVMRRCGLAGQIRAALPPRPKLGRRIPDATVLRALKIHFVVTIEHGLTGGYVVTIDDVHTGQECETLPAAIKDAMGVIDV